MSSTWNVYKDLKRRTLVQVLQGFPLVSETATWAVYPSSRLLAPKVRVFIYYFADCYGSPPYWDQCINSIKLCMIPTYPTDQP